MTCQSTRAWFVAYEIMSAIWTCLGVAELWTAFPCLRLFRPSIQHQLDSNWKLTCRRIQLQPQVMRNFWVHGCASDKCRPCEPWPCGHIDDLVSNVFGNQWNNVLVDLTTSVAGWGVSVKHVQKQSTHDAFAALALSPKRTLENSVSLAAMNPVSEVRE